MNKHQKYLTGVCLILFAATVGWCPWYWTGTPYGKNEGFSFFLCPPGDFARPCFSRLWLEWIILGVIYAGLFFLLKKTDK